jgi:hypothetical protein
VAQGFRIDLFASRLWRFLNVDLLDSVDESPSTESNKFTSIF